MAVAHSILGHLLAPHHRQQRPRRRLLRPPQRPRPTVTPIADTPIVDLEIRIFDSDQIYEIHGQVRDGRYVPLSSHFGPPCKAELHVEIEVSSRSFVTLFDSSSRDPLMTFMAPPTRVRSSFEGLMFIGGVAERWIHSLRSDIDASIIESCLAPLAGPDER